MDKKLPKVFANKINKNIANNKKISYSERDNEKEMKIDSGKVNISGSQKNINQKINDIFNSTRYVYKADVEIKLKDKTIVRKVIGQNQNQLITFENELIPISDILDINFVKQKRVERLAFICIRCKYHLNI